MASDALKTALLVLVAVQSIAFVGVTAAFAGMLDSYEGSPFRRFWRWGIPACLLTTAVIVCLVAVLRDE